MLPDRLERPRTARRPPTAPPRHLAAAGRGLWRATVDEYAIAEPHRRAVLAAACECLDRMAEARAAIARDGLIVAGGRYGPAAHPAVAIERDQKRLLLSALATLDLDLTEGNLVRPRGHRS